MADEEETGEGEGSVIPGTHITIEKPTEQPTEKEAAPAPVVPSKAQELIDKTNAAAERLEKANERHEAIFLKATEAKVEDMLGGKAGVGADVGQKEETPEEYAKKVMANEIETKDTK